MIKKITRALVLGTALTVLPWCSRDGVLPAGDPLTGGAGVGNGGDRYAIEFVSMAYRVLDEVKTVASMGATSVDPKALEAAIAKTSVGSTNQPLTLDGASKDAMNYPDASPKRIVLNRAAWDGRRDRDGLLRRELVLHEYLGILKIDDSRYQVTLAIYNNQIVGNPCGDDEKNVRSLAVQLWRKRWHNVTEENIDVTNGGSTIDGTDIRIVRGYEIKEGHYINALLYAAQCNPMTGKYEELNYSGSGATLNPTCDGQARRFCTGE